MVVLLEGSPITTVELWSSVSVTIRFLVKALLGKYFFHLRIVEATVFLGTFNAADMC
jgi:hypothetical protein